MFEMINGLLPAGFWPALPLIPFFLAFWLLHYWNSRTLSHSNSLETSAPAASEMVKKLLESAKITDIPVQKSSDYSQNEFDGEKMAILLSPDTFDQKDATAVGLAIRAAGRAILQRESPEKAVLLGKLKNTVLIIFWIVFTVLAFGLMGNSPAAIIAGYALFVGMIFLFFLGVRLEFGINHRVEEVLTKLRLLSESDFHSIRRVLRADAMKF